MVDFVEKILQQAGSLFEPLMDRLFELIVALFTSGAAVVFVFAFLFACWATLAEGLRQELRARCFLRLLEIGLQQGRTIEQTIASMARARIRDLGVSFHLVAAWMERGLRLGAALEEVPAFLPKPVAAMLRVGEASGDVPGVLPSCRATLRGGAAHTSRTTNDLMVIFLVSPAGPVLIWIITIFVLPKFRDLGLDMGVTYDPVMEGSFTASLWIGILAALIWFAVWLFEVGRSGGRWLVRGLASPFQPLFDRVNLFVPWTRLRLQRDFGVMLASLLDAGVAEPRAVELAAEATGNGLFQERARKVVDQLRNGVALPEALAELDDAGEFSWRLRNASLSGGQGQRFGSALSGWHESLEARAFQREQTFSQLVSTGLVALNGLMVGLVAVGVFHFLISAMESISW